MQSLLNREVQLLLFEISPKERRWNKKLKRHLVKIRKYLTVLDEVIKREKRGER